MRGASVRLYLSLIVVLDIAREKYNDIIRLWVSTIQPEKKKRNERFSSHGEDQLATYRLTDIFMQMAETPNFYIAGRTCL